MPTARQIITTALTVHLNRLAPGEALDADVAAFCLDALNDIADEWSGSSTFLWRETLIASAPLTGASAQLGVDWPTIDVGTALLGATYNNGYGDYQIGSATMQEYHELVKVKALVSGVPRLWAFDGQTTVYFYPGLAAIPITLRCKSSVQDFADLDTVYVTPRGYKSGLSAVLAERVASTLIGNVPPEVTKKANQARKNISATTMIPGIINGGTTAGNILTGWR